MNPGTVQALLFDIGGVVIDIDFGRAISSWQAISRLSHDELRLAFQHDAVYRQHEVGAITIQEYCTHLADTLKLQAEPERIVEGWNSIFVGEIAETLTLLQNARRRLPCYAFTNTNATHHATWAARFPQLTQSFERVFSSYEIGVRKPDRRAYEFVADEIGLPPGAILFFDDSLENVEAARVAGLQAVRVWSPEDVRRALLALGIE